MLCESLLFGGFGLEAVAGGEGQVGSAAEDAAFLRREFVSVAIGIDELVALLGGQVAHASDGPVDGLTAIGRQLLELLKELARLLFLARGQMLPGLHAAEHALLALGRQAGKTLQPLLQLGLLLRGKPAKIGIVFEGAALLLGRHIFIAAEPVSGVAGLVAGRARLIGPGGPVFFLKAVPLPVRRLGLRISLTPGLRRRMRVLGKGRREQQKRCETARDFCPAQHV